MNKANKLFGQRIKELRESRGLNQEQLAEILGMESRHLSRIETGKSFTSIDNLEKAAEALNVEIKDLFAFKHQRSKKLLVEDINEILDKTDESNVKLIYKLILAVVN